MQPKAIKLSLAVIRPNKTRRSYALNADITFEGGSREQRRAVLKKTESEALAAINQKFGNDFKHFDDCNSLALELASQVLHRMQKDLKLISKRVFNSDNYQILEAYHSKTYAHRKTKDKESAYNDLRRAVEALGDVSLRVATKTALQQQLGKLAVSLQRRAVSKLNQMLTDLGRGFKLDADPKPKRQIIQYVNEADFKKALTLVKDETAKTLFEVVFYSGCRIGEAFGLQEDDYGNGSLRVDKQMLRKSVAAKRKLKSQITATKTEEERIVMVFWEFEAAFRRWCEVPLKEKLRIRESKWSSIIKLACETMFPENERKHCTVHDLRHSFAIRILDQTQSMKITANMLGNSIPVCEQYYTGKTLNEDSMDWVRSRIYKPPKPI